MTTILKSRCHRQHKMIPRPECLLVLSSLFLPQLVTFFSSFVFSSDLLSIPFLGCRLQLWHWTWNMFSTTFLFSIFPAQVMSNTFYWICTAVRVFNLSSQKGPKRPHRRWFHWCKYLSYAKHHSWTWKSKKVCIQPQSEQFAKPANRAALAVVALKQHNHGSKQGRIQTT